MNVLKRVVSGTTIVLLWWLRFKARYYPRLEIRIITRRERTPEKLPGTYPVSITGHNNTSLMLVKLSASNPCIQESPSLIDTSKEPIIRTPKCLSHPSLWRPENLLDRTDLVILICHLFSFISRKNKQEAQLSSHKLDCCSEWQ